MIKADFYSFYNFSEFQYVPNFYKDCVITSRSNEITSGNVSVTNCVFRECRYSKNGGALSIAASILLLVEDTSFILCTTTAAYGGAIYLSGGRSFISRVCAIECSASRTAASEGQFFYIKASSGYLYNNYINNSCIYNSYNNHTTSRYAQYVYNGRVVLTGENISRNECYYYSALYSTSGYAGTVSYCSIVNNTSNNIGCMIFESHHEIRLCNILGNKQLTYNSPESIIYTKHNLFILESCILENNNGKKVFYEDSTTNRIELYKCTLDGDTFASGRYVNNVTVYKSNSNNFINGLKHLTTFLCEATYDSVGTLTVAADSGNQGLSITYIQNGSGPILEALKIANFMIINSFLSI